MPTPAVLPTTTLVVMRGAIATMSFVRFRVTNRTTSSFVSRSPETRFDPHNAENLIAVGMLRMGPWELTGMEVAKVARQRFLDDVTNSVGETFLAHSLQCARCHDHKFDPIPTRDYYSMQSVFATTHSSNARPRSSRKRTRGVSTSASTSNSAGLTTIAILARLDAQEAAAAKVWPRNAV